MKFLIVEPSPLPILMALRYTNIKTNFEIPHKLSKDYKLITVEQYAIYKHCKQSLANIQNDQLRYKTHIFFDTITYA